MIADLVLLARLLSRARASSRWSPEKIRGSQEKRLRRLLLHAYTHVPLYRRLYAAAGFRPEHFRTLDDLPSVPVLDKAALKAAPTEDVIADNADRARLTAVHTSGSSGVPMTVHLGPFERQWQRAAAWRILFEHGYRWRDKALEIRMTFGPGHALQRLGIASKQWLSVLDSPESWARCLADGRHDVIMASAGTLRALAEAVELQGMPIKAPRILISDSETLDPSTRALLGRVLGTDPVDVFGLVELSNFAWQCQWREGFHVSADSHIVEVNAPEGEAGPMIVTDLGMFTMPIIRYATGDIAVADSAPCPCGRTLPLLRNVYGRAVDSVVLPGGKRLFWPFFHEILARYGSVRRWQVIQANTTELRLLLSLAQDAGADRDEIASQVRRNLPESMTLIVESTDHFQDQPGAKSSPVISHLFKSATSGDPGWRSPSP